MKVTSKLAGGLALSAAAWLFTSCVTVPETGRSQLVLFSPDQEIQLGLQSFSDAKKKLPLSQDAAASALLQKVGQRIAAVAAPQMPGARWEFVLFQSSEANAFCLPGGKVGVYTGILPITRDEEGLATVIAHEVAHAVARHGAERLSEAMLIQAGGSLLGEAVSSTDPRWQAATRMAYGLTTTLGRELPHSRAQESEADHIGLLYLARAGYNPETAIAFWQRFADYARTHGGSETLVFLRTHPTDETRIRQLQEWLPRARQEYEQYQSRHK